MTPLKESGAEYLVKPFSPADLIQRVAKLIAQRKE